MRRLFSWLLAGACAHFQVGVSAAEEFKFLMPARIAEIETWLPEQPTGFGRPGSDRAYWTGPFAGELVPTAVAEAEKLMGKPLPPWSDELYLGFSQTGQRPPGEKMLRDRTACLRPLILAECREWRGRFLPQIAAALTAYAQDPTWTLPAHDGSLANFHRTAYSIDLRASGFAAELATALYLLGDHLAAGVRQQVMAALDERIFAPLRASFITGKGNFWLTAEMNWNAVCLAGTVEAALAVMPTRHERAVFVAAGEFYARYYAAGFRADGYCSEGGGYWGYGFGHYAVLREALVQATAGKIELFAEPKVRNMALYGVRYQLTDHLIPPFADSRAGIRADRNLIAYGDRVLGLQLTGLEPYNGLERGNLATAMLVPTPCVAPVASASPGETDVGPVSWFADTGVLVSRPASTGRLAVAIKGAGNGNHSHNDIGSFIISSGSALLVGDPGGPTAYDNKTFTAARYTFKALNSFGHPVPEIGGARQILAAKAKPVVLRTDFTPLTAEVAFDLTSAYAVTGLTGLVRTLHHDRSGAGTVTLRDAIVCTVPTPFVSALTTRATVTQPDPTHLLFTLGSERLLATVETPDGFTLTREEVDEQNVPAFLRLGLALDKPVLTAAVTITFTPVP